ncbi:histidine kinase [Zoogloea sp.]|uniref:sensor histidine kinase n=1 Tax=Zoogloea sp. TaxID=49181 RepID=UPI0035AFD743
MELASILMRRAAAISALCLACVLILALWRGWSDVRQEGRGAGQVALLASQLARLQSVPGNELGQELATLQSLGKGDRLRHLRFEVADGATEEVLAHSLPGVGSSGLLARLGSQLEAPGDALASSWRVERPDGRSFRVTLAASPYSEQREALGNILGLTGVLMLYGLAILTAMYWAARHAFAPLRQIVAAIAAFERQDYAVRLPAVKVRELNVIARALNRLASTLARVQEERRQLSLKVLTLQEDERARIARELHDEFGQALTAMRADATYLQRRLEADEELKSVAAGLEQQCVGIQEEVRNLLGWLGAPGLEGGRERVDEGTQASTPLAEMIRALVDNWRQRPGQAVDYQLVLKLPPQLPQALALSLYRMTQEALTNVARHAGAREVKVELVGDASNAIRWAVRDDGVGMLLPAEMAQRGNGLAGIRERVWAHGGELDMAAGSGGRGLSLEARFPASSVAP